MPKKRQQHLYRLTGGDFRGEGGMGCVYDTTDLLKLIDNPKVDVEFEAFEATRRSNRNSNSNSNSNNSNTSAGLSLLRSAAKDKVAKVFVSADAYTQEKNEIANMKRMFKVKGADFAAFFPTIYQCGYVTWRSENTSTRQKVVESLPCKNILRGIRAVDGTPVHTLFFITMQKLEYSLDDVLKGKVRTNAADVRRQLEDLVVRMHEMHALGMVHCDIKPQNILADTGGRFFFVDLGGVRNLKDFGKHGSSLRSRKYSIVFSPEDMEAERQFDEELLDDLDECFKYLVCRLLGIKSISTLIETFRTARNEALYSKKNSNSNANSNAKQDVLLYVDNFAMAMTIGMYIKALSEGRGKSDELVALEDLARGLFTRIGSVALEFDPRDRFRTTREIRHTCRAEYAKDNARYNAELNNARANSAPQELTHSQMMRAFGVM
jgi:serine/threonine protein kinase